MKCKLVGYRKGSFSDKNTGAEVQSCTLNFVREPNIRESDVVGLVCFSTNLYGESVAKLPKLTAGAEYDCDVGYSKGRYYLNNITAI